MDFSDTTRLYRQYSRAIGGLSASEPSYNGQLVSEVEYRLEQLDFLLAKIRELDQARIDFINQPDPESRNMKFLRSNAFEIRLLTESFYHFAGRLRSIIRHKERPCPYLTGFECNGIRDVRNHLLEHPEGINSRVFEWSWTIGGVEGPVLKAWREPSQAGTFPDCGLYPNAQELKANLEVVLGRALKAMRA